jgi:hypothetical protein
MGSGMLFTMEAAAGSAEVPQVRGLAVDGSIKI